MKFPYQIIFVSVFILVIGTKYGYGKCSIIFISILIYRK